MFGEGYCNFFCNIIKRVFMIQVFSNKIIPFLMYKKVIKPTCFHFKLKMRRAEKCILTLKVIFIGLDGFHDIVQNRVVKDIQNKLKLIMTRWYCYLCDVERRRGE